MAKENGIYKCSICGNTVEMIEAKTPNIVCCGAEMELMQEKTEDEGGEKHVPVLEVQQDKVIVKVGQVPHPMEDEHYIQVVELFQNGKLAASKRLSPGSEPYAEFCLADTNNLKARIYCNIHGAWKNL
ncbi:MAG: desulfoferrodoxin [Nanobdellota archaeon]